MQIKKVQNSTSRKKKMVLWASIVAVVFALGVVTFFWFQSKNRATPQNPIDYNPPTAEQKEAGNKTKQDVINAKEEDEAIPAPAPGEKKNVNVTIVDAGQYEQAVEVRAFAGGIAENGGTCTVEFNQGAARVTKNVATIISANTTQCLPLKISTAEFPSLGSWSVIVKYESATSKGASSGQSIEIK